MLTLKGIKHIRTGRNIKGFRSCPHATGISLAHLEVQRLAREEARLAKRGARRVWLDEEWSEHYKRVAGPLRVLPPSARSGQRRAG